MISASSRLFDTNGEVNSASKNITARPSSVTIGNSVTESTRMEFSVQTTVPQRFVVAQRDAPSTFAALFVEAFAGIRMALAPMPGDVDAAGHPHIFLRNDVVEEPL